MRSTLLRGALALGATLTLASSVGCYARVRNTPPVYGGGPRTTIVRRPPVHPVVGGGPIVNVHTDGDHHRRHHDHDVRIEHDDD